MEEKIKNMEKEIKKEIKKAHENLERNAEKVEKISGNITKNILNKVNNENVLMGIITVLIAVLIIISLFPGLLSSFNKEKIYSVDIIKIEGCSECFALSSVSDTVGKIDNIKIKNEKSLNYASDEAKKLISKYKIVRIPALVISSRNIDKINLGESFRKDKNTAIFDKPVPYFDLSSGDIKGLVDLKEIYDSSCVDCASLSSIRTQLEKIGVKISNYEKVSYNSDNGKELIKENDITYLPTLLTSRNIDEYWWIFPKIQKSFTEYDNYYRFSEPFFPYKEISTGIVKGKVKITYITNNSCIDCFNVTQLKSAFQSLGIYFYSEEYVDVSSREGKNMLVEYNITAIPTAILSKEILDYTTIKDILEKVGTFEDNEYVFRNLDVLEVKYQKMGGK